MTDTNFYNSIPIQSVLKTHAYHFHEEFRMKNSVSIGKKMFLIGIIVTVGLCILGANSYFTDSRVQQATAQTMLRNQQIQIVRDIQQYQLALMLDAMDSIVDKDEGKIQADRMTSINKNVQHITDRLTELDVVADHDEEKKQAQRIRLEFQKLSKGIQIDLVHLIENKALKAEFAKFDDLVDAIGGRMADDLAAIASSVQSEQNEANEELSALMSRSALVGCMTFFLTLGISLPVIYLISRSIVNPIRNTIEGLNEGAEQVASASGQVSAASQSLAEGSSEQAAAIEETSSSLEEMSSMTKQNAEHAGQANTLMKESNAVIERANIAMNEVTSSMEEISKASVETQKIVKTIDEIAFQTNLLALNAAVEAARAGEAGAGFAVVADEVRNLAMRAAEAAKNTSDLIEGTVKRISEGSELVIKTNEAFSGVTSSSAKVGELVEEIAAASNEQAQGIEQINSAVTDMDKVTQQNAASAEESASASEQMNAQAEEMKGMVESLIMLVEGTKKTNGTNTNIHQIAVRKSPLKARKPKNLKPAPKAKVKSVDHQQVNPEQIIPFDDDDFKDF
jgi:methyl-accepting chemotaxis protein